MIGQLESQLEQSRWVRVVRRDGSGVYLASDGRVDPAAPARAREAVAVARDAMARLALEEAERALYDAIAAAGIPATPGDFEESWGTQLELASVLLEARKQNSALQLFARAVVLAPNHEMDPERFSPFVREAFADARRTAALLPRGSVILQSDPAGAEVMIDGQTRGVTPVEIDDLFSGEHVVALHASGRAPFARLIPIGAGSSSRVTVLLGPESGEEATEVVAARLARAVDADVAVVVEASTAAARLRLADATSLEAGAWRELPRDGARVGSFLDELFRPPEPPRPPIDWRVRPGPPTTPWYGRWYVWAVGAAAVGGGIAAALALTSGDDGVDGTVHWPPPDGF
ncbi:MAG: PEGA domain-containing protein [Deltaproteobacteria bacterium]|nr:PEGA domain-containing protein [Deltaproteobacteria bacterium]